MKLSDITMEKIRNKELEKVVPELYELVEIIENNRSHINDPVFDHTLAVLTELEKLFEEVNKAAKDYLAQKIDVYSRKQLLFFATVFHDIGKKETLQRQGDIITFPSHEQKSAEKLQGMISRFILSEREKEMVIQIIKNHGFFHNALDHPEDDLEGKIREFKKEYLDVFLETVLLTIADILGGQLKENNPKELQFRIEFLNKLI